MIRKQLYHRFCVLQSVGFGVILAVVWLGEILDVPHKVFGVPATPVNITECVYESAIVILLAALVLVVTRTLVQRVHVLEGMLAVCAHCKRIRVEDKWVPIEAYVAGHSDATFSHSFCPECLRLHYRDYVAEDSIAAK